jgi:hypothetical protein
MAAPKGHSIILLSMQTSGENSDEKDIEVLKHICNKYYPDQVDFNRINAEKEAEMPMDRSDERYMQETGCITDPTTPKES